MYEILQVVTSGSEIIALVSFAKNIQAHMHTHSPSPTHKCIHTRYVSKPED